MPGNGSAAIPAGSPSVGLADFATQSFRTFKKEALEALTKTNTNRLLSAESYLEKLEVGIVEVDERYQRTVDWRHALAGEVHASERQEAMLVVKRARLSEKAKETMEKIGCLECKVRENCAKHNRAPRVSISYENNVVLC